MTAAPTGPPPARRRWLWRAVAVLPLLPWLVGLAARRWWFAELFTHFRFQWLLLCGAVGLALLAARQWGPLALCGLIAALLGGPLIPGELAARRPSERDGLTVVTANLLSSNSGAGRLLAYWTRRTRT